MMKENERSKKELVNNWCKVFNQIEKGRKVPQDYDKSIEELSSYSVKTQIVLIGEHSFSGC